MEQADSKKGGQPGHELVQAGRLAQDSGVARRAPTRHRLGQGGISGKAGGQ
jgi:hypothetical protein